MKVVLGFVGALIATVIITTFVGFLVTYGLILLHFTGSESAVERCFEIGFGSGLAAGIISGFLIARHFWLQYSREEEG